MDVALAMKPARSQVKCTVPGEVAFQTPAWWARIPPQMAAGAAQREAGERTAS